MYPLLIYTCQDSGGLPCSNMIHINPEGIHSILFSGKTNAKPLPQSNVFFDFHSKVKAFLNYLGWFISSVPLSIHVLQHLSFVYQQPKKIQNQHNTIRDPMYFPSYMTVFFYSTFNLSLKTFYFSYFFL